MTPTTPGGIARTIHSALAGTTSTTAPGRASASVFLRPTKKTEIMPTPEEEAIAKARANDEKLALLLTPGTPLETRVPIARELGIMPKDQSLMETRIVVRMVRTEDGKWWGALEGANGILSQFVFVPLDKMRETLKMSVDVLCSPLMTDEEHTETFGGE